MRLHSLLAVIINRVVFCPMWTLVLSVQSREPEGELLYASVLHYLIYGIMKNYIYVGS